MAMDVANVAAVAALACVACARRAADTLCGCGGDAVAGRLNHRQGRGHDVVAGTRLAVEVDVARCVECGACALESAQIIVADQR